MSHMPGSSISLLFQLGGFFLLRLRRRNKQYFPNYNKKFVLVFEVNVTITKLLFQELPFTGVSDIKDGYEVQVAQNTYLPTHLSIYN